MLYSDDESTATCNGHLKNTNPKEVEFHDMLKHHVGDFSRHQAGVIFAGVMKNLLSCCLTFAPVFIAATPEHWCDVTNLTDYNCTQKYLEEVLLPKEERRGRVVPSKCDYYPVNQGFLK